MFLNRLNILHRFLIIICIETEGQQIFIYQGIDFVINIIHTNNETYQLIVNKSHYKFFEVYINQIFIFQKGHHTISRMMHASTETDILYNITEE